MFLLSLLHHTGFRIKNDDGGGSKGTTKCYNLATIDCEWFNLWTIGNLHLE